MEHYADIKCNDPARILETLWMMFFAMAVYHILVTDYSDLSASLETHWYALPSGLLLV